MFLLIVIIISSLLVFYIFTYKLYFFNEGLTQFTYNTMDPVVKGTEDKLGPGINYRSHFIQ